MGKESEGVEMRERACGRSLGGWYGGEGEEMKTIRRRQERQRRDRDKRR